MKRKFDNNKLKEIIKSRGLRQNWLAAQIGVDEQTIARYMKGETNPRSAAFGLLIKTLGLSEKDLLLE